MTLTQEYFGASRLFRRRKSGPHEQLVELYSAHLVEVGLARQGTWRSLNLVRDVLSWIVRSRSMLVDLDDPFPPGRAAFPQSDNRSSRTCRSIRPHNRCKMFSIVAIEQPLSGRGTTPSLRCSPSSACGPTKSRSYTGQYRVAIQ
jgi:hypothetical protein